MSSTTQSPAAPPATSTTEKPARFYLPALDGLRTVAFLMVWWNHALPARERTGEGANAWYLAFRQSGMYGVPIFFVLSAFLITHLLLAERERTGSIDLRAYYIRRTLRIWPLYFLVVAIAAVQWRHGGGAPPGALPSLATFTANWYQTFTQRLNNFSVVLWSVSVEEQFYLLWPLLLARLSRRALKNLCFAMIGVALLSRVATVLTGHAPGVWFMTSTHFDALGLGTLLALGIGRIERISSKVWSLGFGLCIALMIVEVRAFSSGGYDLASAFSYTLVPLAAAAIVALCLSPRKSFLERPWIVHVGRLTYGMYCYHMFVLQFIHVRDALHIVGSLVATYAVAWISYRFYEERFLRLKHRFERVPSRPA